MEFKYRCEGAIVSCLPSIVFSTCEAAADFARAMNLAHASRVGQTPTEDAAEPNVSPEAVNPLDVFCVCGHERFKHSNGLSCTARKCVCQCFSESPTQPSSSAKPPPTPASATPTITDEERQQLNEQSLILPLPSNAELAHELAHALNALLSFGKRGQLAPKEVGLAGYVAIQRFCKEYTP